MRRGCHRHLRRPAQQWLRLCAVQCGGPHVTGAGWGITGVSLIATGFSSALEYLLHGSSHAGADIEDLPAARLQGQLVGLYNVTDEDIVAGVGAVAKYGWLLAGEHLFAEDRHYSGLAMGILPRPVDIGVAQHRKV